MVRAQPTESQGSSLWGKGQAWGVGTGYLCRDKENIRWRWARMCSSSAGRCAEGGSEHIPGLSHPDPTRLTEHGLWRSWFWEIWGEGSQKHPEESHKGVCALLEP